MPLVTLADFENDALSTLLEYCAIPCLSPAFDYEWRASGHIERAVQLLAEWARARRIADLDVRVHRLEGRPQKTSQVVLRALVRRDNTARVRWKLTPAEG